MNLAKKDKPNSTSKSPYSTKGRVFVEYGVTVEFGNFLIELGSSYDSECLRFAVLGLGFGVVGFIYWVLVRGLKRSEATLTQKPCFVL